MLSKFCTIDCSLFLGFFIIIFCLGGFFTINWFFSSFSFISSIFSSLTCSISIYFSFLVPLGFYSDDIFFNWLLRSNSHDSCFLLKSNSSLLLSIGLLNSCFLYLFCYGLLFIPAAVGSEDAILYSLLRAFYDSIFSLWSLVYCLC